MSIKLARSLQQQLRTALDEAELFEAHVTLDAVEIPSAAWKGCIYIAPPEITFETFTHITHKFELHIIASPADNPLEAWRKIDEILAALVSAHLNMKTAVTSTFQPLAGAPLPAYTITLNELESEEYESKN